VLILNTISPLVTDMLSDSQLFPKCSCTCRLLPQLSPFTHLKQNMAILTCFPQSFPVYPSPPLKLYSCRKKHLLHTQNSKAVKPNT